MSEVPRWFTEVLAHRPEHTDVEIERTLLHLRAWGEPGQSGVVLVHGGAGHSGWWDHVAPFLATRRRVVALDLSGHGDSVHRERYDLELWAREVIAAGKAGGIAGPPVVVGHSMGGWVTAMAGARHGAELDGIVLIDSPLTAQPPEERRVRQSRRAAKVYPDRETILARFVTAPPQDVELTYVQRHVAEQSIRQVEDGWRWKFDVGMFSDRVDLRDLLPEVTCRTGFLRSDSGLVPPAMAAEIDALLGHRATFIDLPATGHHPMLDQPLSLVTGLRALLGQWSLDTISL